MKAPDAEPRELFVFVHGIMGTRANWRGLARKLVAARPEILAVTVDLPMHGDAQAFDPPWTLDLCARELVRLLESLDLPIAGLCGHSFGGKVVMATARALPEALRKSLGAIWIMDSPPGRRSDADESDAHQVIETLRTLPKRYAQRSGFADAAKQAGLSPAVATWLAMNVKRDDQGEYRFEMNLEAVDTLLHDYFEVDAWPWLESLGASCEVHFVHGTRSEVYLPGERGRLRAMANTGQLKMHDVEAGHWLHAEKPDVVGALLQSTPPASARTV